MPANLYVGLGKEFNSLFTCRSIFRVNGGNQLLFGQFRRQASQASSSSSIYWAIFPRGTFFLLSAAVLRITTIISKSLLYRWNNIFRPLVYEDC